MHGMKRSSDAAAHPGSPDSAKRSRGPAFAGARMADFVIPEAPVFRPTAEEFADPIAYLESIRKIGEQAGICKIVPPPGWNPPSTLQQRLDSPAIYNTRRQAVHLLQQGEAFPDGRSYTFREYHDSSNRFKALLWPSLMPPGKSYPGLVLPELPPDHKVRVMVGKLLAAAAPPAPLPEGTTHPGTDIPLSPEARMAPTVEAVYWKIVETGTPPLYVEYANDQDTRIVGSLFPLRPELIGTKDSQVDPLPPGGEAATTVISDAGKNSPLDAEAQAAAAAAAARTPFARPADGFPSNVACRFDDPSYYAETGWNLNVLPFVRGSVLRHITEEVNGMNVPWLYAGQLFTSFAWHNEDHFCYSVNYMAFGEGKTWYGIPAAGSPDFERALFDVAASVQASSGGKTLVREAVDLKAMSKDLLYQLLMVVPPAQLVARGVDVVHAFQEPGTFIVTFPQAYHMGFSHGLNVAEACNFALADWLPYGRSSVERYRGSGSVERGLCFSHESLLLDLARNLRDHPPSDWAGVAEELRRMLATEERERAAAADRGVTNVVSLRNSGDPRYECVKCRHICHVSAVICRCPASRRKVACLRHAAHLCGCPLPQMLLVHWTPLEEVRALVDAAGAAAQSGVLPPALRGTSTGDGEGGPRSRTGTPEPALASAPSS